MKPVLSIKTPGGSMYFRHYMTLYAVSLALLVVIPQPASADSTTLYTTTSDFDGGDKSASPIWFANNGVDQPMYNFINQPQAVYSARHQKTYVAYFGGEAGDVFVTYYNHRTGLWKSEPHLLFSTAGLDGHKNPAIWPLSNGRIIVVGGAHDTGMQVWRTVGITGEIDTWEQMADADTLSTYPSLFEYPSGTLWLIYRSGSFNPVAYRKSTNSGQTWGPESNLIDMTPDGLYYGKWDIVGDRLYLPWTMYNGTTGLRNDIFACYLDLDTAHWFSLAGVDLGITIVRSEAVSDCLLVLHTTAIQTFATALDVAASEVFLFFQEATSPFDPADWFLRFARWDGVWSLPTNLTGIGASSSFADLSMTSTTNGEAFITTMGADIGCSGDCMYTGEMERWSWNGTAWSYIETILSQAKAGDTVNHPYYVWNGVQGLRIVFDQFISVPYIYGVVPRATGDQKLYAWGSNGFVGRSDLNDGLPGVSTTTDNQYIAAGGFTLSNPRNDPFTTNDTDAENWHWRFLQTEDGTNDCVYGTSSGVFAVNWTSGGGTGRRACGLRGQFGITGDFDVRLKVQLTDNELAGALTANLNIMDVPFLPICCVALAGWTTVDGIHMTRYFGDDNFIENGKITAGSGALLGSSTATTNNPEWYRITRVGSTWTTYYSANGAAWTQDETTTHITGKVYVSFGYFANSIFSGSTAMNFDNFDVLDGDIDSDGYRKTGAWRTPEFPSSHATGEIARNITVTYSASADGYIDSVAVVDADDGEVLWENTTDVVAGSSVFYDLGGYSIETDLIGHDFKVRVTLAGNGETSAIVTSVTLATARASSLVFLDDAINIFWLIFFACILAAIFATAWYVKEWRGV